MSDQNFSIRLSNTCKHRINVYLEPWGEVYPLDPNKKLRVDAVGPIGVAPNNLLEIQSSDDWQRLSLILKTVEDIELLDTQLAPERVLWRLFHEDEVRVQLALPVALFSNRGIAGLS